MKKTQMVLSLSLLFSFLALLIVIGPQLFIEAGESFKEPSATDEIGYCADAREAADIDMEIDLLQLNWDSVSVFTIDCDGNLWGINNRFIESLTEEEREAVDKILSWYINRYSYK